MAVGACGRAVGVGDDARVPEDRVVVGDDTGSCTPDCAGRACGSNGCGGSCGECAAGNICGGEVGCVPALDVCGPTAGTQPGAPWPMFRACPTRIGRTPLRGPQTPQLRWVRDAGDYSGFESASPVIDANGTVYVASTEAFHAYLPSGVLRWQLPLRSQHTPTVAADGSLLFVQSVVGGDHLLAISPAGEVLWDVEVGETFGLHRSPVVDVDGAVFVSAAYQIRAFEPDGSTRWIFPTEPTVNISPTLSAEGLLYIFSSSEVTPRLYVLDTDGALQNEVLGAADGRPSIAAALGADGALYVGDGGNYLNAIEPSGEPRWSCLLGGDVWSAPAVGSDGTLYVGAGGTASHDTHLYAVSPAGDVLWAFDTGGNVVSSPAVDGDGIIYVGSESGKLFAIEPDGTERWRFEADDVIRTSPTIGPDQTIYVASRAGTIYAIGP